MNPRTRLIPLAVAGLILAAGLGLSLGQNAELRRRLDSYEATTDARRIAKRNQDNLRRTLLGNLGELHRLRVENREMTLENGMRAQAEKNSEREWRAREQAEGGRIEKLEAELLAARAVNPR